MVVMFANYSYANCKIKFYSNPDPLPVFEKELNFDLHNVEERRDVGAQPLLLQGLLKVEYNQGWRDLYTLSYSGLHNAGQHRFTPIQGTADVF